MRTVCGAISFTRGEEARAVHLRHAHVGDHHGERPLRFDHREAGRGAGRGFELDAIAQLAANAIQHVGLVVDEQDSLFHEDFPGHGVGAQASRHSFQRSTALLRFEIRDIQAEFGRARIGDVRVMRDAIGDVHDARQAEFGPVDCAGSS